MYDHSDEVLDAKVTAGPDIDGRTWQARGHCDPDGIVELAQRDGQTVSAQDAKDLATFCRVSSITYVVGAEDRLPRELHVSADLDKPTMTALAASGGDDSSKELDHVNIDLDIKLTQWGKAVSYTAPTNIRPMDDLGMAVLGLLFQATS